MKNKLLPCICVLLLALSFGCAKTPPAEKAKVTAEPFETVPFERTHGDYAVYDTERELYDAADIVFVGSPVQTFTDGEQVYLDLDGNRTEKDSGDVIALALTLRDIRVLDVIKGEAGDTVTVAEDAVPVYTDGELNKIAGDAGGLGIAKQNVKYIYYVGHAANVSGTVFYYIIPDRGKVNVDGLDDGANGAIGQARLAETRERYAALFEKYAAKN